MPEALNLTIPPEHAGRRLDQSLAELLAQYSRSRLQQWIDAGEVRLDGLPATRRQKVWGGEAVELHPRADPSEVAFRPEAIDLAVVYEDAAVLVLDKPVGRVVHPGAGNWEGTLLNALLHHAPTLAGIPRAGIVHRLDKDTSGLMVVAKTLSAQTHLVRALQAREVKRVYRAVALGRFEHGEAEIDAPIGRHPTQRTRMAVVASGKPAQTHYRVLRQFADCAWVECHLRTGRTHQIRVHLAHIGHPLLGDSVYAGRRHAPRAFPRQALHAFQLGFTHPDSGEVLRFESPLPVDMAELLRELEHDAS
jgi:23S rRNA pseudouridine1911/1915/1917 synthase